MAITIPTKAPQYFMTANEEGQRPPISTMEISSLFDPDFIGRVITDEMMQDSLIAQLMLQGRETTSNRDQVVWKEEDGSYTVNAITGKGLVTRAGNDFSITANAIPTDDYDIDSNRPADAQWIVEAGMNMVIFDPAGNENHGVITAISVDKKTITVTPIGEGVTDWTVGTTDLDVLFYGYNLDHCECPPCIGYKKYTPTRENTMFKDGACVEYCEETLANEGGGAYDRFEVPNTDSFMSVDQRLQDAQKSLLERMEYALAFGRRMTQAQADALGKKSLGVNGIFPTLDNRAVKFQGMIETMADLVAVTSYLKKEGIRSATIKCSDAQTANLNAIVTPTSPYYFSPFQDNTNNLFYIGFGGVKINGVTLLFKEWSALDMVSENLGARYNFVIIPEGQLTKVINGQTTKTGYLQLIWFEAFGKPYKFYRDKDGEEKKCGKTNVDYLSKFTIAVFHPEKWIVGMAA